MHNTLKEKLAQGKRPLGTFVGTGSAAVVECLGCAGLDFVILDNEHSPVEAETTADMVRAAELRGVTPLARLPRGSCSHRLLASMPLSAQTVTCTRSLLEKKFLFSSPAWIWDMTLFHRMAAGLTPPEDTRLLLS